MSGFDLKPAAGIANHSTLTSSVTPNPGLTNRPRNAREILSARFDDLNLIGVHGHEEIYTARDPYYNDRDVKLRVLQSTADRVELELSRLEALAASKLSHSNIIKSGPPQELYGIHFSAVERRVDAENLSSILDRKGWLDPDVAIGITRQLADALEYAHQQGILHLCIHPENILITEDGTAILADFGIDAASEYEWAHTRRSQHCPVHYISPEQAVDGALDNRSDLYSLGVVVYQMLTDRLPLDSEDPQMIRKRHLTQTPLPPHFYSQDVSILLSSVVMCLLEKAPRARYQDARALREALDRFGNRNRVMVQPIQEKQLGQTRVEVKKNHPTLQPVQEKPIEQNPLEENSQAPFALVEEIPTDLKKSHVALAAAEFEESPIRTEDLLDERVLQSWEPPSINVIDPPSHENHKQHVEPASIDPVAHERILDFESVHPSANVLSTKFGLQDTSVQQWRPALLVGILAIATIMALILLGRSNSSPRIPAAVPATVTSDDQATQRPDAAAQTEKQGTTVPSSDHSTNSDQSTNSNPAAIANPTTTASSKPAAADKERKTVARNQPAQHSHQSKRKGSKSTMYFRQSHYGDRR